MPNLKNNVKAVPSAVNPELLDAEAPEATAAWFAKARPASEVLPGLFGQVAAADMLKPKRGRPALAQTKEHVNLRLDADVLGAFRATGAGWQTRVNSALQEWLKAHAAEVRD